MPCIYFLLLLIFCEQIQVTWSPSVSDAFASEMVKLAPPELAKLSFRGSSNLTKFVLSPLIACPLLKEIDLSLSPKLEFVLIQNFWHKFSFVTKDGPTIT